jgi:hypothetical protein
MVYLLHFTYFFINSKLVCYTLKMPIFNINKKLRIYKNFISYIVYKDKAKNLYKQYQIYIF